MPLDRSSAPVLPVRRRGSRWLQRVLLFAAVVLLVDGFFGDRGVREALLERARCERALIELRAVRDQNAALQRLKHRLTSDPETIEVEARRTLGLVKRGELLVVVNTR